MDRAKYRIRFRKAGDLRLVSHHDLMRCFERMLRRAALPYRSTEGFNPKPRLVFAVPLSLGIIGLDEIAELLLNEPLPADEVFARLAQQAPPGIDILSVEPIAARTAAHVTRVCYRIAVPEERRAALPERMTALLATPECWIERTRPQPRRFDLRPFLSELRLLPEGLEMDLCVTPHGTARPEEILDLLGMHDLLDAGAVLERVRLELREETINHLPSPAEEPVTAGVEEEGDRPLLREPGPEEA